MGNGASNWLMRRKIRENLWQYYGARVTNHTIAVYELSATIPGLIHTVQFQCCCMDINGNSTSVAWTAIAEKLRSSWLTLLLADLFEALLLFQRVFPIQICFTTLNDEFENQWMVSPCFTMFHHVYPCFTHPKWTGFSRLKDGFPRLLLFGLLPGSWRARQRCPRCLRLHPRCPPRSRDGKWSTNVNDILQHFTALYSWVWLWTTMNHRI